jgi:hypothetical protein
VTLVSPHNGVVISKSTSGDHRNHAVAAKARCFVIVEWATGGERIVTLVSLLVCSVTRFERLKGAMDSLCGLALPTFRCEALDASHPQLAHVQLEFLAS